MESDTKNKWPYAIFVIGTLIAGIGLVLREATLFGWL